MLRKILWLPRCLKEPHVEKYSLAGGDLFSLPPAWFQGQLIIANVSNGHHYLTRGQTSLEFDGLVISVSVDRAMV